MQSSSSAQPAAVGDFMATLPSPRVSAERSCSVQECDLPAKKTLMCSAHYQRWRKYGDAMADVPVRAHRVYRVDPQEVIGALLQGESVTDLTKRTGIPQQTIRRLIDAHAEDPQAVQQVRDEVRQQRIDQQRAERIERAREVLEIDPSIVTVAGLARRLGVRPARLSQDGTSVVLAGLLADRRRAAGVIDRSRPRWSRQDVLDTLVSYLCLAGPQGSRQGYQEHLAREDSAPSYATLTRHFGTWTRAREAALGVMSEQGGLVLVS